MKHLFYKAVGAIYIVLSLPSALFWLTGRLAGMNTFYTLALGGIPLGAMLILFGMNRFHINRVSNTSLKCAALALTANIPLALSFVMVRAGYPAFSAGITVSVLFIASSAFASF